MYSGLCIDCRHAFMGGTNTRWENNDWHHCAKVRASKGMTMGAVVQCSDYDSKRYPKKGIDHEYETTTD